MGVIHIVSQQKANTPPTVNAGVDQSINLPDTEVTLLATSGDTDGFIVSTQWTKLAGGTAVITSPNSLGTTITGLQIGSYTFQVKVFDNEGASATDTVVINVGNYQALPFKWIGSSPSCVQVSGVNTGYSVYANLLKVSDDVNSYPLDINNIRTSLSGLPQATKANSSSDLDYIAPFSNPGSCPVPIDDPGEFKSSYAGFKEKGYTSTPSGGGIPVIDTFALDTDNESINSLTGITQTVLMTSGDGKILTVPETGLYRIKVSSVGSLRFSSAHGFTTFVDFFLNINGEIIKLAPEALDTEHFTGVTSQFFLYNQGDGGGTKVTDLAYNLTPFDRTDNLTAGAIIKLYATVKYAALTGFTGTLRITSTSMDVNIIQQ